MVISGSQLTLDRYPLPKLEELLSTVSGGKWFSKLDLKNAYLQLALDEESQKLCTLNLILIEGCTNTGVCHLE